MLGKKSKQSAILKQKCGKRLALENLQKELKKAGKIYAFML
jgi:hypothetical protein